MKCCLLVELFMLGVILRWRNGGLVEYLDKCTGTVELYTMGGTISYCEMAIMDGASLGKDSDHYMYQLKQTCSGLP